MQMGVRGGKEKGPSRRLDCSQPEDRYHHVYCITHSPGVKLFVANLHEVGGGWRPFLIAGRGHDHDGLGAAEAILFSPAKADIFGARRSDVVSLAVVNLRNGVAGGHGT